MYKFCSHIDFAFEGMQNILLARPTKHFPVLELISTTGVLNCPVLTLTTLSTTTQGANASRHCFVLSFFLHHLKSLRQWHQLLLYPTDVAVKAVTSERDCHHLGRWQLFI